MHLVKQKMCSQLDMLQHCIDLCLVASGGTLATDLLSSSSSVLCCHLHLPPAVLRPCCPPHILFEMSLPNVWWSHSFSVYSLLILLF